MNRRIGVFVLTIAAMLTACTLAGSAQSLMTRHVREVVLNGQAQPVGHLPAAQVMQIDIVLPLRDQAGLDAFVADVYNPSSPNYRHFLTPEETSALFGPTQENWDALVSFAKENGFTVVNGSLKKRDLVLTGTVSAIESAFNVTMRTYQHPTEDRVFYSPDREPYVSLPFQIEHISGLDNYSKPHPLFVKRSDYAAALGISAEEAVSHATTGSGPSASFLGSDMRAAYYGGTALTGAGQTVGLFEYVGTDLADLTTYYKNAGQTEPFTPKLVSVDGTSLTCTCSSKNMTTCENGTTTTSCDDTEQTLDMTQAMGMAPGLAGLTMYVGSTDTAIISAMTTTADGPLPGTIGCSWGWTPADPSTLDGYFETMAAQGQNFFAASGDSSTWSSSNEAWPADDAHVVSVGGTDLVTASAAGPWSSETAWADSGGGISPDSIAIPSWQAASGVITSSNKGSTTLRNGPDVSANANFTFYTCSDQTTCQANAYGGTSFAAPMWAGYIALVNQQLASNGKSAIGFIDPLIYPIGTSSSYDTDFHDITSGTSGSYSAVTGFDLVTGWGTPNGVNLINALAGSSPTAGFSLSATAASVTDGSTGTSTAPERHANVQFLQLLVGDGGGGFGHEVDGLGGFGEGDDLAQAGCAGQQHDDAVQAEGNAAVGRGAVFESFEEEAEAGAGLFVADAERLEDLMLHVFAMDADGAGAELEAVHCQVVAVGANTGRIAHQVGHVGLVGRGEGMVRRHPFAVAQVVLEHGEIDDPDGLEGFRAVDTALPPHCARQPPGLTSPVTAKAPCRSAYFLASSVRKLPAAE
jgi:subtilase family serine protease